MLRTPLNSKFKYQFNRKLPVKGLKGFGTSQDASIIIKSKNSCLLTPQQLEVSRRILAKPIREEEGKLNIQFFPNLSLSKKPLQTRMGKGKGRPEKWVASIRKGAPLFSIIGHIPLNLIKNLYSKLNLKLPVYSKLVINKKMSVQESIKAKTKLIKKH